MGYLMQIAHNSLRLFRASFFLIFCIVGFYLPLEAFGKTAESVAVDSQWLALLHMHHHLYGYKSEVDKADFFKSGNNNDPLAELESTLDWFARKPAEAWCRFPARGRWLVEHGYIEEPVEVCAELRQWRSAFYHEQLTLIFPTVYLNSASSMFGHSFLRFDAFDTSKHSPLLSKSASYYADLNGSEKTLEYIYKGLFGGFKGSMLVSPYFEMLRKYNDDEDRDVWEYQLNYSSRDIDYLIDHLWEVRGQSFDYFFLDENCAYRVIAFLDVITPGHNMTEEFNFYTLPTDTLKVLSRRGLIKQRYYRPSATKLIYNKVDASSGAEIDQIKKLSDPQFAWQAQREYTQPVLATSTDILALRIHKGKGYQPENVERLMQVVEKRINSPGSFSGNRDDAIPDLALNEATTPPDASHGAARLRLLSGTHDGDTFTELGWREVFHDFDDPPGGFAPGVRLELLGFNERHYADNWQLQDITWVAVESRSRRSVFFSPLSWSVNLTRKHELVNNNSGLVNALDLSLGTSWMHDGWIFSLMPDLGVRESGRYDKAWAIRSGLHTGILYQSLHWSANIELATDKYIEGEKQWLFSYRADASYHINNDSSLHVYYSYTDNNVIDEHEAGIGLQLYF